MHRASVEPAFPGLADRLAKAAKEQEYSAVDNLDKAGIDVVITAGGMALTHPEDAAQIKLHPSHPKLLWINLFIKKDRRLLVANAIPFDRNTPEREQTSRLFGRIYQMALRYIDIQQAKPKY